MNKYYKIFIAFVLVLGLWIGLNGWGPANPLIAYAQEVKTMAVLGATGIDLQ